MARNPKCFIYVVPEIGKIGDFFAFFEKKDILSMVYIVTSVR